MSLSVSLSNVGNPVAYYPRLARFFGSVNVAILFAQLHYWSLRGESDLGTYKTSEEFTLETGLSYREQATARKALRDAGYLIETARRLEHRVYFKLNLEAVDAAFEAWTIAQSANDENAFREMRQAQSGECGKRSSRGAANAVGGVRKAQSVINTEIPTKTPTETPTDILSTTADAAVAGASAAAQEAERKEAFAALCRKTWEAYAEAYFARYKTEAVRNAKGNTTVVNLVKRLGAEAPDVARFFVERVSEAFVVRRCHGIGDLLAQCEAFRTQWASGTAMTSTGAQATDKTSANFDAIEEAKRLTRQRKEARNA